MATVYDQAEDVRSLADRIRAIAALIEDAPVFEDPTVTVNIISWGDDEVQFHNLTKGELVALVRWLGGAKKFATEYTFYVTGKHHGIAVTGFARDRGEVCQRVVVGTRVVPAKPEHEEEVVEWQCEPLLAEVER